MKDSDVTFIGTTDCIVVFLLLHLLLLSRIQSTRTVHIETERSCSRGLSHPFNGLFIRKDSFPPTSRWITRASFPYQTEFGYLGLITIGFGSLTDLDCLLFLFNEKFEEWLDVGIEL